MGLKATDRWAVPLTRDEHEECHTVGSRKEEDWFLARGVDCFALANALWQQTGDLQRMTKIVEAHCPRKKDGQRSSRKVHEGD